MNNHQIVHGAVSPSTVAWMRDVENRAREMYDRDFGHRPDHPDWDDKNPELLPVRDKYRTAAAKTLIEEGTPELQGPPPRNGSRVLNGAPETGAAGAPDPPVASASRSESTDETRKTVDRRGSNRRITFTQSQWTADYLDTLSADSQISKADLLNTTVRLLGIVLPAIEEDGSLQSVDAAIAIVLGDLIVALGGCARL